MMGRIKTGLFGLLLLVPLVSSAELTIEITGGSENAIPVAVAPFEWAGGGTPPTADYAEIISSDLKRSGRFRTFTPMQQPAPPTYGGGIDPAPWRARGMDNVVFGRISGSGGSYRVEFTLYDAAGSTKKLIETVRGREKDQRFLAHHVADIVYEALTGERGAFATRIAYITAGRSKGKQQMSLKVADSDGHNAQSVASTSKPLMSPAWSPDGKRLAYVSFEGGKPGIYIQQLSSGSRTKVTSFPGINGAPAWSPDGTRLALTLSKGGNPDIYVLDIGSRKLRQVTHDEAIDTEPAWSPDGKSLVFTSDRAGTPQIYRVSASGGTPRRVTYEGKYNANASWSPDGKSLTLISRGPGGYQVAILHLDTGGMQLLSDGSLDESSSFAPNGSMIIFAEGSSGVLTVVSTDYDVKTRLKAQSGSVRDPAWSPFLTGR